MHAHSPHVEVIAFDDPTTANMLFGPYNAHLELLGDVSGARISSKGCQLLVETDDIHVRQTLCNLFLQLYTIIRSGTLYGQQDIIHAYKALLNDPGQNIKQLFHGSIAIDTPRKSVTARNIAQKTYLELLRNHEMVFATGPAGTGKTYLAVAMAIAMLQQHKVKRIVLTRPAVEAGERLGFLPGDLAEKVNPYLRPLYDALNDMMHPAKVTTMLENGTIEVAPLAFMRGRTLNDAYVILDEAQNTTPEQMKMFLTRMGFGSRVVVTGDTSQIDLVAAPGLKMPLSGLVQALSILKNVQGLAIHHFSKNDVVRHPLVGAIVHAYDCAEENKSLG